VKGKPFEQIVAEHGPVVLRVCRAVLGATDADDAWSETFLAALRAYPDLPENTNIEAWLVTVAHRKAIDQYRARARRPIPTGELPEPAAARADTPGIDHSDAWEALAALPEKQRLAITYHHLAGFPYVQVAALLGNNEPAARRAAADGIHSLRKAMARSAGPTVNTKGQRGQ
jgi:RNA polymerase sigma factor (sigma-70 family)